MWTNQDSFFFHRYHLAVPPTTVIVNQEGSLASSLAIYAPTITDFSRLNDHHLDLIPQTAFELLL